MSPVPLQRLLIAVLLLLASSCITTTYTGHEFDEEFDRTTAPGHIVSAQEEIASGEIEIALDRLIELHQAKSIDPADRKRAGELLNTTALTLIEQLVEDVRPSRLKRLFRLELPPRLRVEAGVAAGRAYLADSERVKAFRILRSVEQEFPMHHQRMQAGDILLETGVSLAEDGSTWFLFFSPARDRAIEVLDFLVLNYPFHPGCDLAYWTLASLYEETEWYARAIRNHEDLVAFHPDSGFAPESEARIPLLRMARIDRPDYDRHEVLRAREEAASWLERHPNHELRDAVGALLERASSQLVENDLMTARFYLRIDQGFGARLHAERARAEALLMGSGELEGEALALLAKAEGLEAATNGHLLLDPTPELIEAANESGGIDKP